MNAWLETQLSPRLVVTLKSTLIVSSYCIFLDSVQDLNLIFIYLFYLVEPTLKLMYHLKEHNKNLHKGSMSDELESQPHAINDGDLQLVCEING